MDSLLWELNPLGLEPLDVQGAVPPEAPNFAQVYGLLDPFSPLLSAFDVQGTAEVTQTETPPPELPQPEPAGGRVRRKRPEDARIDDELALVRRMLSGEDDEPKPTPRKIVRRLRQAATHVEKAAREGSVAPAQTVERVAALQAATEVALEQPDWGAYIDALLWTRALLDRLMAEAAEMDDEEALLLLL